LGVNALAIANNIGATILKLRMLQYLRILKRRVKSGEESLRELMADDVGT
jgi:hypothetical protein